MTLFYLKKMKSLSWCHSTRT